MKSFKRQLIDPSMLLQKKKSKPAGRESAQFSERKSSRLEANNNNMAKPNLKKSPPDSTSMSNAAGQNNNASRPSGK